MNTILHCRLDLNDPQALFGLVLAQGVQLRPTSAEFNSLISFALESCSGPDYPPVARKDGIRALLRRGGFSPSGRNKPSSEYLAQAARESRFPRINNLVDINNLTSLQSALPISMLDLSAFQEQLLIRYGRPDEAYVFNSGGQEIELAGLICACSGTQPLGNAVKDSMVGKLKEATDSIVCIVYASAELTSHTEMTALCSGFAALLKDFGGAKSTTQGLLHAQQAELVLSCRSLQ